MKRSAMLYSVIFLSAIAGRGLAQDSTVFAKKLPLLEQGADTTLARFERLDSLARKLAREYYLTQKKRMERQTTENDTVVFPPPAEPKTKPVQDSTAADSSLAGATVLQAAKLDSVGTGDSTTQAGLSSQQGVAGDSCTAVPSATVYSDSSTAVSDSSVILSKAQPDNLQVVEKKVPAGPVSLDSLLSALRNEINGMIYAQIDYVNRRLGEVAGLVNSGGNVKQKRELVALGKIYQKKAAALEREEGKRLAEQKRKVDLDYVDSELSRLGSRTAAMTSADIDSVRAEYRRLGKELSDKKATKEQRKDFERDLRYFELTAKDLVVQEAERMRLARIDAAIDCAQAEIDSMALGNFEKAREKILKAQQEAGAGSEAQQLRAKGLDGEFASKLDGLVQQSLSESLGGAEQMVSGMSWENREEVGRLLDTLGQKIALGGNLENRERYEKAAKKYGEKRRELEEKHDAEERKEQFENTFKKF